MKGAYRLAWRWLGISNQCRALWIGGRAAWKPGQPCSCNKNFLQNIFVVPLWYRTACLLRSLFPRGQGTYFRSSHGSTDQTGRILTPTLGFLLLRSDPSNLSSLARARPWQRVFFLSHWHTHPCLGTNTDYVSCARGASLAQCLILRSIAYPRVLDTLTITLSKASTCIWQQSFLPRKAETNLKQKQNKGKTETKQEQNRDRDRGIVPLSAIEEIEYTLWINSQENRGNSKLWGHCLTERYIITVRILFLRVRAD